MCRHYVQEVSHRKTAIRNNNNKSDSTKSHYVKFQKSTRRSEVYNARQYLLSADIVLRFAAMQLKPPLHPHHSLNFPHLAKGRHYCCNSTYQYRQVITHIHSKTSCYFTVPFKNISFFSIYVSQKLLFWRY